MKTALSLLLLLFIVLLPSLNAIAQDNSGADNPRIAGLNADMQKAITRVKQIVNQPVQRLTRQPDMRVSVFSPGWFHAGATKPDFNKVDIRTTQQFPYSKYDYVTSDLNPGQVFIGSELEFNSMTKYFYTDRNVPKKKLTQNEMLEINKLYRVIGRCEQEITQLQNAPAEPEQSALTRYVTLFLELAALSILFLLAYRKFFPAPR